MQTRNSIITGVITSAMADYYLHLMTIFSRKLGSEPVGRLEVPVRAVGSVEPAMSNCQTLSEQNGNKNKKNNRQPRTSTKAFWMEIILYGLSARMPSATISMYASLIAGTIDCGTSRTWPALVFLITSA